jgi:SAM-dependent methyltransferase
VRSRVFLWKLRRRARVLPHRTARRKRRLLTSTTPDASERALLHRVTSRVSPRDTMYASDRANYFKVGLLAMRSIEAALERADRSTVAEVLDLPCGHGRVLRFLAARFPEANVTACDLERDGVDFCARVFGATPVYSTTDLDSLSFESRFDLIWCGSLITHLDRDPTCALLRLFARHLAPCGVLVFTTHGDRVVERMTRGEHEYMLERQQLPSITTRYVQTGFGYEDYPGQRGYGVAVTSPTWIRERVAEVGGLTEVYFAERGWGNNHDVYGYAKRHP